MQSYDFSGYDLSERCATSPDDASELRQIRVDFDIPVWMTQDQQRRLLDLIGEITDAPHNEPVNGVLWPSGVGSMPLFSKVDAAFLGKPIDQNAPESGEPSFDDSVFHVDCCARPFVTEEERDRKLKRRILKAAKYVAPVADAPRWVELLASMSHWFHQHGLRRASWIVADVCIWLQRRTR